MPVLSNRRKQQLWDLLLANLTLVATLVAMVLASGLLSAITDNRIALNAIPLLVATLAVTSIGVALHPGLTWTSLGLLPRNLWGVGWGVVVGGSGCVIAVAIAVMFQWAEWTAIDPSGVRFDWRDFKVAGLALLVIGACAEELFMRGMLLQLLGRSIGAAGGIAATSAAFALMHGGNPGVTWIAQLNTALFGAVFGLSVLRSRAIWLACGLHVGWNVAQVALGVNVSGITIRLTDLQWEPRGVDWLSGGDYGLEGGILATGAALALAAVVWAWPGPRGTRPLYWHRAAPAPAPARPAGGSLFRDLPPDGSASRRDRENSDSEPTS